MSLSVPVGTSEPIVRTSHVRRIAGVFSLAIIGAMAFEATVRVEELVRFGVPLGSPYRSSTDLVIRDANGMHGRVGAVFEKWRMNNVGTRGPDIAAVKNAGTFRIIVVGASESFGLYESPGHEYPRILEQQLNQSACAAASGAKYEVLNAALPGMTLPTIAQDMRLRLKALAPDVVVVYPTPVQYLDGRVPTAALPDSAPDAGVLSPFAPFLPRSLGRLRSAFKSIVPDRVLDIGRGVIVRRSRASVDGPARDAVDVGERLMHYQSDLEDVLMSIQAVGAEAVVVAHLNALRSNAPRDRILLRAWERFYPQVTGDVIVDFDSAARPLTEAVVRAHGARFIDATQDLDSLAPSAFADYSHFTDRGASALADAIARGFLGGTSGMMTCPPASTR